MRRSASGVVNAVEPLLIACSGVWVGARRRCGRPRGRHRSRRSQCPSGVGEISAPPRLVVRGGGARILRRLFQQRLVAALPSHLRAAGVSIGGFQHLPRGERALCRRRRGGGGRPRARGAGAGLPLRARAADDSQAAAVGGGGDLLAHPVAALADVCDMSVARRNPRRDCWAAACRLSDTRSIASTSSKPSIASLGAEIDCGEGVITYQGRRVLVRDYPASIEWPGEWTDGPSVEICRARGAARSAARHRRVARRRRRQARLHERDRGEVPDGRTAPRTKPDLCGKFVFVELAEPSRQRLAAYRKARLRVLAYGRADQPSFREGRVPADSRCSRRITPPPRSRGTSAPPMCVWSAACTTA